MRAPFPVVHLRARFQKAPQLSLDRVLVILVERVDDWIPPVEDPLLATKRQGVIDRVVARDKGPCRRYRVRRIEHQLQLCLPRTDGIAHGVLNLLAQIVLCPGRCATCVPLLEHCERVVFVEGVINCDRTANLVGVVITPLPFLRGRL